MRGTLLKNGWLLVACVILALAGCTGYGSSGGTKNPHVAEAISHAEEAVDHGGMGHADAVVTHAECMTADFYLLMTVVTHAEVALQHAQAAQKDMSNPHLDAGVAELGEAITHGKAGHADVATSHAKSAVMHLKEI